MKIGCDLDGVVADFVSKFLEFYNHKTANRVRYDDWKNYDFSKSVGITSLEAFNLIREFYKSDYFNEISLIDGADIGLKQLCKEEDDLHLITARPKFLKNKTEEFLEKNLKNIFLETYYSGFLFKINKLNLCKRKGIDLIIEDRLKTAIECAEGGINVFLYNQPWNKNGEMHENIIRVNDWDEILNKIRELKNGKQIYS